MLSSRYRALRKLDAEPVIALQLVVVVVVFQVGALRSTSRQNRPDTKLEPEVLEEEGEKESLGPEGGGKGTERRKGEERGEESRPDEAHFNNRTLLLVAFSFNSRLRTSSHRSGAGRRRSRVCPLHLEEGGKGEARGRGSVEQEVGFMTHAYVLLLLRAWRPGSILQFLPPSAARADF